MIENKEVMAINIQRQMDKMGIDRKTLAKNLNVAYSTLSDWINAKKYPRIDKIERMAHYFGIEKSDLIEDKQPPQKPKELSKEEKTIIKNYNSTNKFGKKRIETTAQEMAKLYPIIGVPSRKEMINYLSELQIAASNGNTNIYNMTDEELENLYTIAKENE